MNQDASIPNQETCAAVSFAGGALAPLFLEDPAKGSAGELFSAFASIDPDEAAREWPFVEREEAAACLETMRNGLAQRDTDALMWEFRRLFVGPDRRPAPPYGSVYTDRDCVIFGESNTALHQWMRAHGIERFADSKTPDDHIGLMLLLMTWLADNKPELLVEYLRNHLLTWSSHFLDELAEAAEHPFYIGCAKLSKATLEGIGKELNIEIVYPRFYR